MRNNFSGIQISSIASALPSNKFDVRKMSSIVNDDEVNRIIAGTGIKYTRSVENKFRCSDLCYAAAYHLISQENIDPTTIDAIILISQTSDFVTPATSVYLQNKLKLKKEALALDINYGCSGYIYGLFQASLLISSGVCSRILLCVGDVLTPLIKPQDYQTRMLLSDAGTATLVEKGNHDLAFILKSDGSGAKNLIADRVLPSPLFKNEKEGFSPELLDGYFHMNGGKVMEFVLREIPALINEMLTLTNFKKSDIDLYVFHQANAFIVNYIRKILQLHVDVVPIALEEIGNTNSASIPVLLSLEGNKYKKNGKVNNVILAGFGVGLSWGAASVSLNTANFYTPIEI